MLIERELARFERLAGRARARSDAVEDAGGTAHYHSVDLTDADAVDEVLRRDPRHQRARSTCCCTRPGVEISHALPDKEPREFDLVLGVKADGWFNVLHAADDLPLGTVVAFSSVAGPVRQRRADRLQRR